MNFQKSKSPLGRALLQNAYGIVTRTAPIDFKCIKDSRFHFSLFCRYRIKVCFFSPLDKCGLGGYRFETGRKDSACRTLNNVCILAVCNHRNRNLIRCHESRCRQCGSVPGNQGAGAVFYDHADPLGKVNNKIDLQNCLFIFSRCTEFETGPDLGFKVSFMLHQHASQLLPVSFIMCVRNFFSGNKIDQFTENKVMPLGLFQRFIEPSQPESMGAKRVMELQKKYNRSEKHKIRPSGCKASNISLQFNFPMNNVRL